MGGEVDPASGDPRITGSSSDCLQISCDSNTLVTSMGKTAGKKEGDTNKKPAAKFGKKSETNKQRGNQPDEG